MKRSIALLLLLTTLTFSGCGKIREKIPFLKKKEAVVAAPVPAPVAVAVDVPKPVVVVPPDINMHAAVMVLCYHRFEDRPKDSLAINPLEFDKQMQALKENGFTVIPMGDFLAWRRDEKPIPAKCCVITIDDGYRSGYDVAWPILKKYGYPFTMFIYTNYIKGEPNAGGQSMTWEELATMRDAGVDIQSHSVSHSNLKDKSGKWQALQPNYEAWLRQEMVGSKLKLERNLGISVKAFAYPYGNHNAEVRRIAMESGYEAAFTVYGQRLAHRSAPDQLGRYAIESLHPKIFEDALKMTGGGVGGGESGGAYVVAPAASSMITQPLDNEVITNGLPVIKANLATLGEVDAGSVEMRVSGLGPVGVKYDPSTKTAEYVVRKELKEGSYSVFISAKVGGIKKEVKWSFTVGPVGGAQAAQETLEAVVPGKTVEDAPVTKVVPKKKKK